MDLNLAGKSNNSRQNWSETVSTFKVMLEMQEEFQGNANKRLKKKKFTRDGKVRAKLVTFKFLPVVGSVTWEYQKLKC